MALTIGHVMIPKIIHQTWKNRDIPDIYKSMQATWLRLNPEWELRFWTDEDLLNFIHQFHPDFLDVFNAYPNPVQKADAARYLILHRFGGVYADLDTTCVGSLDQIADEGRVVLSCEPVAQARCVTRQRNLDRLIANCVMASPAGHPFWLAVKDALVRCRHGRDVLETTGPLLLTGAVHSWQGPEQLAIHSCHLFAPLEKSGTVSDEAEFGLHAGKRLAIHHWAGSWYREEQHTFFKWVKGRLRKCRAKATRGYHLRPHSLIPALKPRLEQAMEEKLPEPGQANVAVLMPVRDAERHLEGAIAQLRMLDYPKDRLKIVFCEGDSKDETRNYLERILPSLNAEFRSAKLLSFETGYVRGSLPRWHVSLQRKRRAAIARVRNHLIGHGLDETDDWALWIDADVVEYPSDVLRRLWRQKPGSLFPIASCSREVDPLT